MRNMRGKVEKIQDDDMWMQLGRIGELSDSLDLRGFELMGGKI